eukprot:gnl/MRDRNA2_/MRDRNA2_28833_c0_seq2.p1 gnl/MRDRNA2_/MRDRNA2_28833_c0~~gnl/MRDRNA2_/MRDRNA2_28833_c0_seq2.p1  ORF type:complete len:470 (+),score=63.82 gnl/MRDRNA2_/MRDRNA2_28833_c0_seq2:75-1484(+)
MGDTEKNPDSLPVPQATVKEIQPTDSLQSGGNGCNGSGKGRGKAVPDPNDLMTIAAVPRGNDVGLFEDARSRRQTNFGGRKSAVHKTPSKTEVGGGRHGKRVSLLEGLEEGGVSETKNLYFVTLGRDSETVWKVIAYKTNRLLKIPFAPWTGTVFQITQVIWVFEAVLLLLSVAVIIGCYLMGYEYVNVEGYKEFTGYLNTICPFLVGLYIREVLMRWWSLRQDIMVFHSAIYDLCMHFATCDVPRPRYERVVRYGLIAQVLLFQIARKAVDLTVLEEKGLLTRSETAILETQSGNISMVPWVWLSQDVLDLMRTYRIALPKLCFQSCEMGRASFSKMASTLTTPLPFAYIHIISLIVFFNNVAAAFRCGFVVFNNINDWGGFAIPLSEVLFLIIPPLLYQGGLHIGEILENPFEDEILNFPLGVYHTTLARNCISMFNTAKRRRELYNRDESHMNGVPRETAFEVPIM